MSAEALRKAVVEEIDKLNAEAMTDACGIRATQQSTTDGIALTVVDRLAMARAFAQCAVIVNQQFRKLTQPPDAKIKQPYKEMY